MFTKSLFDKLLTEDLLYNIYCLFILYFIYTTHLRSLFLATVVLILTLFSYPVATLVIKGMFGVTYFNQL